MGLILALITTFLRLVLPQKLQTNFFIQLFFDFIKFPPPIAWIPLVILLFGIGERSAWIIVAIGAYPALSTTFFDSIQNFPKDLILYVRTLRLSRAQMFYHIYFQSLLPRLLSALRVSFGMGWMCIVAAEMISSDSGLGYLIQLHRLDLNYPRVMLDIFLIGLIGYFVNIFINKLEEKLCPWSVKQSQHA